MLGDLVNGGCVEEGSEGANNPLSRLGKAVLDFGRQRDAGGGGSSQMDAALPPGPGPSSAGMLPQMGPSEAAFMHAYEHDTQLQMQREWEAAAAMHHGMPPPSLAPGPSAWNAAWNDSAAARPGPPMAHSAMPGPHMQGGEMLAAQRRAESMHMQRRPPQPGYAPYAHAPPMYNPRPMPVEPGYTAQKLQQAPAPPPTGSLSRSDVQTLDAAHEEAWRTLAASEGGEMSGAPFLRGNPRTAPAMQQSDVHLPRGDSNAFVESTLENSYADTLSRGLSDLETRDASAASTAAAAEATSVDAAAYAEMEAVWKNLSVQERQATAQAVGAADESDLGAVWQSLKGGDYAADWEDIWNKGAEDVTDGDLSDVEEPYRFHENNPHLGGSNLLERGTMHFRRGELQEAILVLEAAVQQKPDDSIAWQTLGQTHADSDDDARAITCLRRAVAADPRNLDALLALGVSYTNELDATRALSHLKLWLSSHPDFTDIVPTGAASSSASAADAVPILLGGKAVNPAALDAGLDAFHNPFELQKKVTDLFLKAVARRPMNADLHAVLGVLYNLSRSYPEAVNSFEKALQLRPDDYSLWNKLGATQANAMACGPALPCYIKALELKPQYVRSLSNLGISYGNMSKYNEAAQCYLKALSLNPEASHIWGYLTMTLTSMDRPDLVAKAATGNHEAFREAFDF